MFRYRSQERGAAVLAGVFALIVLQAPARADDVFSRCAKARNDDAVKTIPASLVPFAARLYRETAQDAAALRSMYVYRCMSGAVWICNHGANIPCAKGDQRRTMPSLETFCRENPNDAFVPMVVTGHSTIHSWRCLGGRPKIIQSEKLDRRGFVADQWLPAR